MRILVCGDVRGQFTTLLNRVTTVNKKNGPFQMLLCVGSFFSSSPNSKKEWEEFVATSPTIPIPMYILGPNTAGEAECFSKVRNGGDLLPDLTFLGRQGIFTMADGLSIAFLSGVHARPGQSDDSLHVYKQADVDNLALSAQAKDFAGVDILLTTEWPRNIKQFAPAPPPVSTEGSASVARLAHTLQPRYHFAAGYDIFYERVPYRNHKILVENPRQVTRFLSIANVGNADKKNRWIYAFNLVPMTKLSREEVVKQPDLTTESPLATAPTQKKETASKGAAADSDVSPQQFFFDMSRGQRGGRGGGHRGRGRGQGQQGGRDNFRGHADSGYHHQQQHHHGDGGVSGEPAAKRQFDDRSQECWFCLGSAKVEKHLVVTVGTQCYVALAKGPLVDDHLLILPVAHHPDSVSLPPVVHAELDSYKKAIVEYCKAKKHSCVFFERNFRSRHLQLQAVPIRHSPNNVKSTFLSHGEERGVKLVEVTSDEQLDQLVDKHPNFFLVEFADGQRLFHFIKPNSNFPLQFAREVLASSFLLDLPRRVHWKDVKLTEDEESALVQKVRTQFTKFDPAGGDDDDSDDDNDDAE